MLLAIDIGNTNINFGVFKGLRLIRRFLVPTKGYSLKKIKIPSAGFKIDSSIICSVVPSATKTLKAHLGRWLGKRPYIIGKDIIVPIKNKYRRAKEVGQDRLVNAYAGAEFYGLPLVAVDFGTAITFDVVSENREYLGGMILPGLGISLEILAQRTALLPKIKLKKPTEFIGRDTANSMLSGVVYGFSGLVDSLTERIKNELGQKSRVIGTGGDIGLMSKYCRKFDKIDPDLTLKGLSLIYHKCLL